MTVWYARPRNHSTIPPRAPIQWHKLHPLTLVEQLTVEKEWAAKRKTELVPYKDTTVRDMVEKEIQTCDELIAYCDKQLAFYKEDCDTCHGMREIKPLKGEPFPCPMCSFLDRSK